MAVSVELSYLTSLSGVRSSGLSVADWSAVVDVVNSISGGSLHKEEKHTVNVKEHFLISSKYFPCHLNITLGVMKLNIHNALIHVWKQ